jgi:hypothetical protein
MDHKSILRQSLKTLDDRGEVYGGVEQSFERAAQLATLMLDRIVTPHEVTNILIAVKLARAAVNPFHIDSYVDAINYMAFSAEFVNTLIPETDEKKPAKPDPQMKLPLDGATKNAGV